ncbi:3'-5' exonuclease [Yamadazyma tenuis]|uniref:RNA exonuclease 4 n=1 Tax=Candida tenuis (strain ATCC 10573 / BCRC 21748 / CBS 615 / JCM 9827 / NBRC 10315 / NRRL Y-1498 / VKM Y-70) TaxID=590646 RepID=G3B2M5_CANTC|nr:exonuclease [Yamadazyma tenuis ATCC 10573]EGV64717.1 exonuclease [Yamadazyma tenuis ATCC 10573]WEJ97503.1 3'-5' exonuclease [Yamadazyma tenuis]
MSGLSSNWARLQSNITPKSTRKTKKTVIKRKAPYTPKETEKVASIITSSNSPASEIQLSTIASALWTNEHEISEKDIENVSSTKAPIQTSSKKQLPGKYLAIDCEFVGVGPEGEESALARVSIVNFYGYTVYDKFVKPREKVTDWRTWVSGVTPKHMKDAATFKQAQEETSKLLDGKILVGHAVHHDLDALFLSHPKYMIRDTTSFKPFRAIANGKTPSLKKLTKHFLKIDIQDGSHSSVEDARATMLLFRLHRKDFEKTLKLKR